MVGGKVDILEEGWSVDVDKGIRVSRVEELRGRGHACLLTKLVEVNKILDEKGVGGCIGDRDEMLEVVWSVEVDKVDEVFWEVEFKGIGGVEEGSKAGV